MATDAMILTAAREYHTAVAAVKAAEDRCKAANAEQTAAAKSLEDTRTRAKECEKRLLTLSVQKPAEPAPVILGLPPGVTPEKAKMVIEATNPPNAGTVPTLQKKRDKVSA